MDCKDISPECPIGDTTYGYYPSLPGNALLAALFAICAISQIFLGIRYRLRLYSTLVFLGCVGEAVGYIGRILLHSNPWNNAGFIMQVLLLIVSPSFLAAALYLTLKQLVVFYGPQHSKLKPTLYSWLFISCDAVGFLAQLVGGGISSSASDGSGSSSTVNIGNDIMIAGIAFQAGTMAVAGILGVDFALRVYRNQERVGSPRGPSLKRSKVSDFYLCCTVTAFVAILIRCIYRIPEMASGWGNSMMRNEVEFMVLDGAMIAIGAILMTIGYPGAFSPSISTRTRANEKNDSEKNELDLEGMQQGRGDA